MERGAVRLPKILVLIISAISQSPLKRRKKARPTRRAPVTAQLQVRTFDVRARPRVHPELLGTATCCHVAQPKTQQMLVIRNRRNRNPDADFGRSVLSTLPH